MPVNWQYIQFYSWKLILGVPESDALYCKPKDLLTLNMEICFQRGGCKRLISWDVPQYSLVKIYLNFAGTDWLHIYGSARSDVNQTKMSFALWFASISLLLWKWRQYISLPNINNSFFQNTGRVMQKKRFSEQLPVNRISLFATPDQRQSARSRFYCSLTRL